MARAKSDTAPYPAWRNRIVGHGDEAPDQLLANPRNWRVHPKAQQDALGAVLDEVGWVQEVIVNRITGNVVDGHLRVALAITRQEPTIPVKYVELTPDEEGLVLATLDPLAGMAVMARDSLEALLDDVPIAAELVPVLRDGTEFLSGLAAGGDGEDGAEHGTDRNTFHVSLTPAQLDTVWAAIRRGRDAGAGDTAAALTAIAEAYAEGS